MKKFAFISLWFAASMMLSCQDFDEPEIILDSQEIENAVVEQLSDGRLRVTASITASELEEVSVSSRAGDPETTINSGWCLIFGVDPTDEYANNSYTDGSPLLQKIAITPNSQGRFYIDFEQYVGVAFLRVVANLTDREEDSLEGAVAWGDTRGDYYNSTTGEWTIPENADNSTTSGNYTYSEEAGAFILNTPTSGDKDDLESIGTFGAYLYQSVGLDGIYDMTYSTTTSASTDGLVYDPINETRPDPANPSSVIPMSSIGFVLDSGINEESLKEAFTSDVYMVRVCSKVDVTVGSASGFTIQSLYMIDCAQESRIRSSVLSMEADVTTTDFGIPVDLGGTINYLPLDVSGTAIGGTTDPIYIYPNSGGNYSSNGGAVDQDVNPQYLIIKGRASGYDTDGYYKVALKAQYVLSYKYQEDSETGAYNIAVDEETGEYIVDEVSAITYDILRNVHFNVELIGVDKPGYKTLADAMDANNPASNISYSITIIAEDGRNEILVSKGTYYVELQTTRVYAKGFSAVEGIDSNIEFTLYPNTTDGATGYQHPAAYIQGDYGVTVTGVTTTDAAAVEVIDLSDDKVIADLFDSTSGYYDSAIVEAYLEGDTADDIAAAVAAFKADLVAVDGEISSIVYKIPESTSATEVTVNFSATTSGRVRMRIGDMLKFIPVRYEVDPISYEGGQLEIGNETSFAYYEDASLITYYTYLSDDSGYNWTDDGSGDWFGSDGKVAANGTVTYYKDDYGYEIPVIQSSDSQRTLKAKIYPIDADGITKLVLKQDYFSADAESDNTIIDFDDYYNTVGVTTSGQPNTTMGFSSLNSGLPEDYYKAYLEVFLNNESVLEYLYTLTYVDSDGVTQNNYPEGYFDGFYIDVDGNFRNGEGELVYITSYVLVAAKMIYILSKEYTTVYFHGEYKASFFYPRGVSDADDSLLDLVEVYVENTFSSDYTYSLDFSEAETNITVWEPGYFAGNTYLKSVVLPASSEAINDDAFSGCTSLETVRVAEGDSPSDFEEIGEDAFYGCTSLSTVTIYTTRSYVIVYDGWYDDDKCLLVDDSAFSSSALAGSEWDTTDGNYTNAEGTSVTYYVHILTSLTE